MFISVIENIDQYFFLLLKSIEVLAPPPLCFSLNFTHMYLIFLVCLIYICCGKEKCIVLPLMQHFFLLFYCDDFASSEF